MNSPDPFRRSRRDFQPAYVRLLEGGILRERAEQARETLRCCRACPRQCEVNRLDDDVGICRTGRSARVASAFPHFGEEDCLRGLHGSGTIFFSGCNLRCVFCQNSDISWAGHGEALSAREIAHLALLLQEKGCHNINFVTPEHIVPQLIEIVYEAARMGLRLPLVYNTGAYDSLHSLEMLDGLVDIYMPDFKFWNPRSARRLLLAEDYPDRACEAIREMHRQVGDLSFDEDGVALRGLLVRHLVMPDGLEDTRRIMHFLANEISCATFVNIMGQYHPDGRVVKQPRRYRAINRAISTEEVSRAERTAREEGLYRLDDRGAQQRFI